MFFLHGGIRESRESGMDEWLEIARREAGITSGSRQHASVLVCTSYNPEKHCIKGILQPHGVETGWIPIGITGAGPNFGVVIGPKAGDPKKLDGDQFSIEFENGDANTPIARHRLSSGKDTPPKVETGEHATISQFNHSVLWKKDGSIVTSTHDKDVAEQNKNTNPLISHSATSVQNNKTINHATTLDPVKQTLTHASTDGATTHSIIFDLIKKTLTQQSKDGSTTHSTILDLIKNTFTHQIKQGSNLHSIVLDAVKGIIQSSTAAHSRTASSTITDTSNTHTINAITHDINALTNISKLLKTTSIAQLTNYIH